ncbi:MAG: T9SS type A sorting domain-containing protein, partial [Saprospiraceae bacterium]|nr:T9SS type A sorting domain-containing protein [Saprospiraceae bacterium]
LSNDSVRSVVLPLLSEVRGKVTVGFMPILTELDISGLSTLSGSMTLQYLDALVDLPALDQLSAIGGHLKLNECRNLSSLDFLNALEEIGGFLELRFLKCSDLNGLSGLTQVPGGVYIGANTSLTAIDEEWNITSIGGDFTLIGSSVLSDASGLDDLMFIGGDFSMTWTLLEDVDMLQNVSVIGGDITIRFNHHLLDLHGIAQIDHQTIDHLRIENNDTLSVCHVASICAYLNGEGSHAIADNLAGCNSGQEVRDLCNGTSSTVAVVDADLKIVPTAVREQFELVGLVAPVGYRIVSIDGSVRQAGVLYPNDRVDVAHFAPGLYWMVVEWSQGTAVRTFVVLD